MVDYGIKVSKPGEDVKTCGDDDLVFSSEIVILKTRDSGSFSETVSAYGSASHDETHNLSEAVVFMYYFEDPTNNYIFQGMGSPHTYTAHENTDIKVSCESRSNELRFTIYNGYGTQQTIEVYWEYFYENV